MKVAAAWSEEHELADGTHVRVRMIRPEDREGLRTEFRRLSPESRYRRFFAHMSDLSDEMLRYLTEVDGVDHVAIIATVESPDLKTERGVGVARFVRTARERHVAEAAVTVVDDMQRKGVGRLLGLKLVEAALERGVTRFRGEVLTSNVDVLDALGAAGASLTDTGVGTVAFEVPIGPLDHEPVLRRLFREIAASVVLLLREMRPPPPRGEG